MKKKKLLLIIAAIIVALLLIFLMVRWSVNRNLGPKVRQATGYFTNGVLAMDGTSSQSLSDALNQRLSAADKLLNLAAKYDEVYSAYTGLRSACNDLLSPLKNGGSLAEIQAANVALTPAFQSCYDALEPYVSGKNAAILAESAQELADAADAVSAAADAYNSAIRSFRKNTLDRFPTSILKGLLRDPQPELWP